MQHDEVTDRLAAWAVTRDDVYAMVMTSTRAIPDARVDAYSDYDVVIVVEDVASMAEDREWLTDFGDVLVSYWDPVQVDERTGAVWVGSVNNYANGLKIDFSVWSSQRYTDVTAGPDPHPEFDAGHRVLVDKFGLTSELPPATYQSYIPPRPDNPTYQTMVSDFLIGVPYVAKSLLRHELLPAKWVLDFDMRFNYLVPLLEWRIECDRDWTLKTGMLGKGLAKYLPTDTWAQLVDTFTGPEPESNWDALFTMIDLSPGPQNTSPMRWATTTQPTSWPRWLSMPGRCDRVATPAGHDSTTDPARSAARLDLVDDRAG